VSDYEEAAERAFVGGSTSFFYMARSRVQLCRRLAGDSDARLLPVGEALQHFRSAGTWGMVWENVAITIALLAEDPDPRIDALWSALWEGTTQRRIPLWERLAPDLEALIAYRGPREVAEQQAMDAAAAGRLALDLVDAKAGDGA